MSRPNLAECASAEEAMKLAAEEGVVKLSAERPDIAKNIIALKRHGMGEGMAVATAMRVARTALESQPVPKPIADEDWQPEGARDSEDKSPSVPAPTDNSPAGPTPAGLARQLSPEPVAGPPAGRRIPTVNGGISEASLPEPAEKALGMMTRQELMRELASLGVKPDISASKEQMAAAALAARRGSS